VRILDFPNKLSSDNTIREERLNPLGRYIFIMAVKAGGFEEVK
jgi:hypothetical protein